MPVLALCKICMIGSPVLILGIGRTFTDNNETHWDIRQLFTCEEYLNHVELGPTTAALSKYHGGVVHFSSINKTIIVTQLKHDFNLDKLPPTEISIDELKSLREELRKDDWMPFDDETWGK